MKHVKLFESLLEKEISHLDALSAYKDVMSLVSMFDGYVSEVHTDEEDRYWGNIKELESQIDSVTDEIKTTEDVIKNWGDLKGLAQKLADGADRYLIYNVDADRYLRRAPSVVRSVKKIFEIE